MTFYLIVAVYGAFCTAVILSLGMTSARSNKQAQALFEREEIRRWNAINPLLK